MTNALFTPYKITKKTFHVKDTWIIRATPLDSVVSPFMAGQFCLLKNPAFSDPNETHAFSIASSPTETKYLEFCVKVYGNWTEAFTLLETGDTILVSKPFGAFVWKNDPYAVFLVGGIGITPVMSILRFLQDKKRDPEIVLIYGSRTPGTIAYKEELEQLGRYLRLRIIHIFSHLDTTKPFEGYHGFITEEIIKREVILKKKPTFFVVGPPIFIEKMIPLLRSIGVDSASIKTENFSGGK